MRLLPFLLALVLLPICTTGAADTVAAPKQAAATERLPLIWLHGKALKQSAARVSVDQLDKMAPQTQWQILDPYRQQDVQYSGIQLRDLVAALAPGAQTVRMRAVNDYITVFTRAEWEKLPILLATRDSGQRMNVRNKGPARIVYLNTLDNQLRMQVHAPKWIWQVIDVEFISP